MRSWINVKSVYAVEFNESELDRPVVDTLAENIGVNPAPLQI
jgi:hypothetical protein